MRYVGYYFNSLWMLYALFDAVDAVDPLMRWRNN
jgi:hypothetical protein